MDKKLHQEIIENDALTLTEKIGAVFAALPPDTEEQQAARNAEIDEEFYVEFAGETLSGIFNVTYKLLEAAKNEHGEQSEEYETLKAEIEPIRKKLRDCRDNIEHPNVRAAIEPLQAIWRKHRGWDYNDQGGISKTDERPDRSTLSAIQRATSFDI